MFFILGGVWTPPMFIHPHMFVCPHVFVHPQGCTSPYVPILLCASVCSWRLLYVLGVVRSPLHVGHFPYTSPIWVPPLLFTPQLIWWLPCALVCSWDICMLYGDFPLCWGCSPSVGGSGGISTWDVHMLILVHFVVCYVSHFYYGYNYYSSSYGGIFWPVINFISDHGSFPDGVSSNHRSVWSGSTTTLDSERLRRCYWLCLCATAATSIFNASSGLCQLCYGFSTGRFLFQS